MAAPTFVSEYEAAWGSSTSPKTVSVTTQTNDRLIVIGAIEASSQTMSTPTGGTGLTWTLEKSFNSGNFTAVYVWSTTETGAGQTFTLSVAKSGSLWWGFNCLHFRDSDGIGASAITNTSGAPSLNLTTTQNNSAIVVINGDWNALDGTSRTWRTNAGALTEDTYFRDGTHYAVYAGHHADAGATGTYAVGLSAPSGQAYTIAAIEIKGTTGGAAVPDTDTDWSWRGTENLTGPARRPAEQFILRGWNWQFDATTTFITDATLPGETASGVDAVSVSTATSLSEAATGTDAISVAASFTLTDTGSGSDNLAVGVPKDLTDTGSFADSPSVTATVALSDTGALTDALGVSGAFTLADTASGSDGLSVAATVPLTDTGSGTDSNLGIECDFKFAVGTADTGTGTDAVSVSATVSLSDTGSGVDAISVDTGATPKSLTDTGSGTDSVTVSATVALSDTASGTDAIASVAVTFSGLADTGTWQDNLTVQIQLPPETLYFFIPPVLTQRSRRDGAFWSYWEREFGITILKVGSTYEQHLNPMPWEVEGADAVYWGGRKNRITEAEAAELTTAGYGANIVTELG